MLVGFVGVLIALGPSAGSLGDGLADRARRQLYLRALPGPDPQVKRPRTSCLQRPSRLGRLAFGAIAAPLTWVAGRERQHYLLLLVLGAVSIAAIVCVNQSLRLAPASVVVPYHTP